MSHTATSRRAVALALAALAFAIAVLLGGCGTSYPSTSDALKAATNTPTVSAGATLESGVLTVGVNANNAPYSWPASSTSGDGALQGIDVDVAFALAEEMGLSVKFVNVGADYEAASKGTCDVVIGATSAVTPSSEVLVGNYLESAPAVFGRSVSGTVGVDRLAAATIAVQADSISARTLASMVPSATLSTFSTLNDAFEALEQGSVDFVACDSLMGGYLATSYADISFAGALALPDMRGVAVAASNSELQSAVLKGLDAITSDGILRTIRASWVGDLPSITTSNQVSPAATTDTPEEAAVEEEQSWDEGGDGDGGEEYVG